MKRSGLREAAAKGGVALLAVAMAMSMESVMLVVIERHENAILVKSAIPKSGTSQRQAINRCSNESFKGVGSDTGNNSQLPKKSQCKC